MRLSALLPCILFLAARFAEAKKDISLQWAICEPNPQEALQKLGLGSTTPPYKENPITYYDESPPVYLSEGLMFRTKTNKGQPLSTVKTRFPDKTKNVPDFVECTWDRYGDDITYTCEKRCPLDPALHSVWCDEQVEFAERYEDVDWSELTAYGPFSNAKWKLRLEGHKAKFDDVAAGSLHLMEIEVKTRKSHSKKVYKSITRSLEDRGIVLCDPQEGKTMRLFREMGYLNGERSEL